MAFFQFCFINKLDRKYLKRIKRTSPLTYPSLLRQVHSHLDGNLVLKAYEIKGLHHSGIFGRIASPVFLTSNTYEFAWKATKKFQNKILKHFVKKLKSSGKALVYFGAQTRPYPALLFH